MLGPEQQALLRVEVREWLGPVVQVPAAPLGSPQVLQEKPLPALPEEQESEEQEWV